MAPPPDFDDQDVAEVFDEDNTNTESQRQGGREDAEQFEDLVDVLDVTRRVGDEDDDEAEIGEDMDDGDIVSAARDEDDDDDDLEDDDLRRRDPQALRDQDLEEESDPDAQDPDDADGIKRRASDEVELEYAGDLNDLEGAGSGAGALEADELDDDDLRELDYKED